MDSNEIRKSYLKFFVGKKHALIPPAPLVPPDDPTTLFTSSGMQPLVPYLKGEPHPKGKRLVDSQPCFRANDIDEVGDNRHTTFFEMLGNWSLGDYFKEDQLAWFWEWLTEELHLSKDRLHVTIFDGDKNLKRKTNVSQSLTPDVESKSIWLKIGVPEKQIHWCGSDKNWWSRAGVPENMPVGEIGGPDSEVFFDFDPEEKLKIHENSKWAENQCNPNCDCGRFLEIGNSVFMEFEKQENGVFKPLPKQNVDFGGGLERLTAAVQNIPDIFQIDIFQPAMKQIDSLISIVDDSDYKKDTYLRQLPERIVEQEDLEKFKNQCVFSKRVIADHLRAAVFMVSQGLEPDNKQQGYMLRRLIRRAVLHGKNLGINGNFTKKIAKAFVISYKDSYPDICKNEEQIYQTFDLEETKFRNSLEMGLREFNKYVTIGEVGKPATRKKILDPKFVFNLFQTFGFPYELTKEEAENRGIEFPQREEFEKELEEHKKLSRTTSAGMFKGGLADRSEDVTKLHTTTHLLQAALRQVLGEHVHQEGSNITSERLRFDFSHPQALSVEEMKQVEKLINQKIKADLAVVKTIEDKDKALASGAMAFFRENYPDKVSVYTIGDFSKELCGGPHASSTAAIGGVKLIKQEAIGAGKRRVYAVLKTIHHQRNTG